MLEHEGLPEIHAILTDETAYRVHVLTTFRELDIRLDYIGKLQEEHNAKLGHLLLEHGSCFADIKRAMKYEEVWQWGIRVKQVADGVKTPVLVAVIIALLAWVLFLYVLHPMVAAMPGKL